MNRFFSTGVVFMVGAAFAAAFAQTQKTIVESARQIPLVGEADVVVVGGTTAGVAAALAAKEAGASVWLLAERPYLGDDMAGTLQLVLPDDAEPKGSLAEALWTDRSANLKIISYQADAETFSPHKESNPPSVLTDGLATDPVKESVQYNEGKVTVTAKLGEKQFVEAASAVTFLRQNEFDVSDVKVSVSDDGQTWSEPISLTRLPGETTEIIRWEVKIGRDVSEISFVFQRKGGCKRILVGEIACEGKAGVRRVTPTPLKVKQTFDRALLAAKVKYLTGAFVTDVLSDAKGDFSGVVIADRGGRQAIIAKTLVDATPRGLAARLAGSVYPPFSAGKRTFTRFVISGERPSAEGMDVTELPGSYQTAVQWRKVDGKEQIIDGKMWRCTFQYDLQDDSYASYAAVEQHVRNLTFTKLQLDAGETVVYEREQPLKDAPHVFACFRHQPWKAFSAGGEAGGRAAADAKNRGAVAQPVAVRCTATDAPFHAEVCEQLTGLTAYEHAKLAVLSPKHELPILGEYDVVVAGGGTGGAPAAIGAARGGAKTLVIEYLHGLGGIGTLGMIGKYWYGKKIGFTAEHDKGVAEQGVAVHVVGKREWWRKELLAAGGEIWFGTMACGALREGNRVTGVVVATPYGRGVVLAKNVIDGTGNADLAAVAGAETEFLGAGEIALQGAGLSVRPLGKSYVNSDWGYVNDCDPVDSWLFGVRGRLGAGKAWDVSQIIETRERRRVKGAITVSPLDVVMERTFPDTIAQGASDFDSHGPSVADICYVSEATNKKIFQVNIPYRAILPEKLDGLAVIGIAASAHRDALPIMRMQSDVQNTGYAAGRAAAMSAKSGKPLRNIDVKELQRHLAAIGSIPQSALEWDDGFTVDAERWNLAVRNAGDGYKDVPLLLTDVDRALPPLRAAYTAETNPTRRLCYAHILGIMGDATGAETLARQIDGRDEPVKINVLEQTAYGRRMGERDALIVGLGRTKSPLAVEPLLRELEKINGTSSPSHVRAVTLACEAVGDAKLAPALAKALTSPKMGGHVRKGEQAIVPMGGFGGNPEFARCLRELNVARALVACGDYEGLGRTTFEDYAEDGRGVLALHARAVLEKYFGKE